MIVARNITAVINTNIAISTANVFLEHSKESLNKLFLGRLWARVYFVA